MNENILSDVDMSAVSVPEGNPTCVTAELRELIRLNTQVCVTMMQMVTGNPMIAPMLPAEIVADAKKTTARMMELWPHVS